MNDIPAFPTGVFFDDKGVIIGGSNGMTLRDYFAAKAIQKLMGTADIDDCCESAYKWADAMIKARGTK